MKISGQTLVEGRGNGPVAAIAPLSFWGGYDPATGVVIDRHHPARGQKLAGTVLLMPSGRGSSSASGALAEAIRLGTEPAAIVLKDPDAILVIGAMVAEALYGRSCPIVVLREHDYAAVAKAAIAEVIAGQGTATITVP